jgi:hypothetical protein
MSKKLTIAAMIPEKKDASGKVTQKQLGPVNIVVDTAENIKEAEAMFGGEAILSNAEANWVITLQSNIRSGLKKGETQEQIQARLAGAKMGVAMKGAKVDPLQAYAAMFASATPEKQKQMIADLQARAAKK